MNQVTEKVEKLTGDFNKAAEKSGAGGGGSGGSGTSGTETTSETTTTTTTTTDVSDSSITPTTETSDNQTSDVDYNELLQDALIRRDQYIQSGDQSKLNGVNKKIEFYQKQLNISSNVKSSILVVDQDGKVQKVDNSQLSQKTEDNTAMLNNSSTSGSKTIIVQRQIVQTNVAVPV